MKRRSPASLAHRRDRWRASAPERRLLLVLACIAAPFVLGALAWACGWRVEPLRTPPGQTVEGSWRY